MNQRPRLTIARLASGRVAVLSHALVLPDSLSHAEKDVCRMLLEFRSTQEIAHARGTTPRTVANQVRRIFDKLGVDSRLALCAALLGTEGSNEPASPIKWPRSRKPSLRKLRSR